MVEPRPAPHLPWGIYRFVCLLCGEPVSIMACHKMDPEASQLIHMHARCHECASAPIAGVLTDLAIRQVEWENRAQLN